MPDVITYIQDKETTKEREKIAMCEAMRRVMAKEIDEEIPKLLNISQPEVNEIIESIS